MNRANQRDLVNRTNMILIAIRSTEINYFTNFYSNFGTQSAILVGVIVGAISQNTGYNAAKEEFGTVSSQVVLWIYFVSSAATAVFAMQVLLSSVFIVVYGQGLALRGPVGSMIRAVDGMLIEQKQVLISYVLAVSLYVISEVGLFFYAMDDVGASVGTAVVIIGAVYTYVVVLRIYNRFNFTSSTVWEEEMDPYRQLDELDRQTSIDRIVEAAAESSSSTANKTVIRNSSTLLTSLTVLSNFFSGSSSATPTTSSSVNSQRRKGTPLPTASSNVNKQPTEGGYLTLKTEKYRDPWERRYFILRKKHMFFYKDKKSFELEAGNPMNRRPIELEEYSLLAGALEPPYLITLIPLDEHSKRKAWCFRCDTSFEFQNWIQLLNKALNAAERENSLFDRPSDLVILTEDRNLIRSIGNRNSEIAATTLPNSV